MSANDFEIIRDQENDIIYVIRRNVAKEKTINVSITENITIRRDPADPNKIVGLTIEEFSKVLPHLSNLQEYHLMEKFEAIIEFLNAPDLAFAR
jgi:hypothetical protein